MKGKRLIFLELSSGVLPLSPQFPAQFLSIDTSKEVFMESRLNSDKCGESQTLLWSVRTCLGFKILSQIFGAAKGHKVRPSATIYLSSKKEV